MTNQANGDLEITRGFSATNPQLLQKSMKLVYAPSVPPLPMHVESPGRPFFCRLLAPYTVLDVNSAVNKYFGGVPRWA